MSLGTTLSVKNKGAYIQPPDPSIPWLTADEMVLLSALDKNFQHPFDEEANVLNQINQQAYMKQQPDKYQLMNPTEGADFGAVAAQSKLSKSVKGGFIQYLPLIGSLASPLVMSAIKGIRHLIKRRHQGRGGVVPPNSRGGSTSIVAKYFNKRMPQLRTLEKRMQTMHGKPLWNQISHFVKGTVNHLVPKLGEISPQVASQVSSLILNKQLPKSFQKIISQPKKGGGESQHKCGDGFTIPKASKPVVKWALGKLIKDPKHCENVYHQIKSQGHFDGDGREIIGGKRHKVWKSIKKFSKNVLLHTLPTITKVGLNMLGPAVDKIFEHFGINNEYSKVLTKKLVNQLANSTSEVIKKKLTNNEEPKKSDVPPPTAPIIEEKKTTSMGGKKLHFNIRML